MTACATVPAQTVSANGVRVGTITAASACRTVTYTVPTVAGASTVTVTVSVPTTTTATATTTVPAVGAVWAWDAATATVAAGSAGEVGAFQSYAVAAGVYLEADIAWVDAPAGTSAYSIPQQSGGAQGVSPVAVPVPPGTRVGVQTDHSLAVIGPDGVEYDFNGAVYDAATARISGAYGIATVQPGGVSETGPGANNADAAKFPLAEGPVTPADVAAGVIAHPLVCSMPNVGQAPNPYPAGSQNGYPGNTGLPLGTWVRLDPAVNVAALGLPPLESMIAVALQRYGMFVRDIGSELDIVASDQVNQGGNAVDWPAAGVPLPISYQGVPYAQKLSAAFPWTRLQVLLPPAR